MKKFLLFLSDVVSLYLSLVLTLSLRYEDDFSYQYYLHLPSFILIFSLWLLVFYIANLYDVRSLKNNLNFYSSLFQAIIIAAGISIAFFYLIPIFRITPKTNLFIFIAIFSGLETAIRSSFNSLAGKKFKKPLLIVGLNSQTLELAQFIKKNPQSGYQLAYMVNIASGNKNIDENFKRFGIIEGMEDIDRTIRNEKINTVVISPEAYQIPEIIDMFYRSLEHKVTFRNLSSFYENLTNRVPLGAINQIWFLENLSEGGKSSYEVLKRFFDIAFAVILGLASLLIYPFIILVVKITSPGPIFYRQKRLGQAGKTFEIIKFRTMDQNAEKFTGAVWTVEGDPRITKIGNLLRKMRIDELPQLWNILKGEMSFVGPRAERPEFHEQLKQEIPFYEERYIIKPGLSGWAQINYRYGSSVADAAEKLQYDLYYIKNRSLILDLGIILKTINIALKQAGR